ncbi:MAG: 50S ribosomal protein L15 [Dehalococcoidia bacterium]
MRLDASRLAPAPGAVRPTKRVGRGNSAGGGTYAGRGLKGQKSRSGKKLPYDAFEGGQFPASRRFHVLRGFNNRWRVSYQPVNVSSLNCFADGTEVTPELLRSTRIVRNLKRPIKVLGRGELERKLDVRVSRVSSSARAKIEGAGGTVTEDTSE